MSSVLSFPRGEAQAIGLIAFAHMLSHLYYLALAPLLIPITTELQISSLQWGTAFAAYAVTTGILQTPMGLLVERIGGRSVLVCGLLINAVAIFLMGWVVTDFFGLIMAMTIAGVGNSVFHPADYSLISSSISEDRLGSAYSIHNFVGHLGFLLGPIISIALEPFIGWRGALMVIGAVGMVMSLALFLFRDKIIEGKEVKKKTPVVERLRDLLTSKPVLLFFMFFMGTSLGSFGLTQFSVAAFQGMYGFPHAVAVIGLTAYQIATLSLVLPGGILADRLDRYDAVLMIGFGTAALAIFIIGTNLLPFWAVVCLLIIGGAMRGMVTASRDVAVRHIAGDIPVGTVFGFVSTGFVAGQALAGPIYGWILDHHPPEFIFFASAAFSLLALSTVLFNSGSPQREKI